ncbi:MAG: YmdB family metallophosphoesterase [Chloroflexota bacterium]|nr:YmdB family metallophosphoesterase [Chloroflexota bacterium]
MTPGQNPAGDAATKTPEPTILRILAVGDVIGAPGRHALRRMLPAIRSEVEADLVVANAENSAAGRGVGMRTARELRDAGADVLTTGNHVWAQPDVDQALGDDDLRLLRPLNFPSDLPGRGACTVRVKGYDVTVVSLLGRVFMNPLDDPFRAMDTFLLSHPGNGGASQRPIIVVDFHAEATSEKLAMGWHLAGRVTAVVGTHTHVPTADARVLPGETGYVTDLGMVGPRDSIIGAAIEPTLHRFLSHRPTRSTVADGPVGFNALLVELDAPRGTCRAVYRVDRLDSSDSASRRPGSARHPSLHHEGDLNRGPFL